MQSVIINPIETLTLAKKIIPIMNFAFDTKYLKVYACNNANDSSPAWEEITTIFLNKSEYYFINDKSEDNKGAISIKIELEYIDTINFNESTNTDYENNYILYDNEKAYPQFRTKDSIIDFNGNKVDITFADGDDTKYSYEVIEND